MSARRRWAWPLVPVYRAGLAVQDALRAKPKRLRWPVVSVGSVSAGGAGKTPVVIALAKLLQGRGWDVNVLSRGYRREGKGVEWVAAETEGAAQRFGDEPVVIARESAAPVWVGASRYEAGLAAEANGKGKDARGDVAAEGTQIPFGNHKQMDPGVTELMGAGRLHLLDDGFQHRGLARDFDLALVTAEDLDDSLLPAGNLREPLDGLRRADAVVVREEEFEDIEDRVWPLIREGAQMWVVRRRLVFPAPLFVFGAGLRPVAFCAVARPEGFATMLMEAGCGVVETVAFDDHHGYAISDMDKVIEVARNLNGTGFVTTEKDAVKLTGPMLARLETIGPLMVVKLEAEFADKDAVMRTLETRLSVVRGKV